MLHVAVGSVLISTWVSNVETESVRSAYMRQLQEYVAYRPFVILCNTLPASCCRFSRSGLISVYVVVDNLQDAREYSACTLLYVLCNNFKQYFQVLAVVFVKIV